MKTLRGFSSHWQRFVTGVAAFAVASVTALSLSGCGGSSSSSTTPTTPTVAAPGAPTAFSVTGGENVATLQWSPPVASATTGEPTTYEIYGSTTDNATTTLVDPANLIASIPVVATQTTYSYTALNLVGGNATHYFVVAAKNAGGETPSAVASADVTGPKTAKSYGNNFSAALIFADDFGITNQPITGTWTGDKLPFAGIDYNTGLRPLQAEVTAMGELTPPQTTLPYLTVKSKIDDSYYEQKSINTWQGQWVKGKAEQQNVTAKWGDNLVSASLSAGSKIRIEMVLTKDVTATPMTVYPMTLLSGSGINELQGTTGIATTTTTAFVFATNARLTIHKLDAGGNKILPAVDNQALFDTTIPDGINKLSAEIPVSGNFTYGYVWDPATKGATAGNYRLTFSLDANSVNVIGNPANNTFIQTATNGVRVSDTEVYIDVELK